MEANYLDFRYLQFKKIPNPSRCCIFSIIAGIVLSLPYFWQLFAGSNAYCHIQPYHDASGFIRVSLTIDNPYGFNFIRYVDNGFKLLIMDLIIRFIAIGLWTFFMCFLLNDTKKRWQIFPLAISIGFTLPVMVFTISFFNPSRFFTGLLNNPLTIYLLLTIALSITLGIKKLMFLLIPGLIGYSIGYLVLVYMTNQIMRVQFVNIVPTEKIINWLTFSQITQNLIWNFFIGIGVYATYGSTRKLAQSFAHFEDTNH